MKIKRFTLVALTSVLVFSLASCQVNWFDRHYDVPWWVIVVPAGIFSLIIWVTASKYIASKQHVCPKCNSTFYPKWWKAAISIHMNDDRVFKCPHCGRKSFCHISRETGD